MNKTVFLIFFLTWNWGSFLFSYDFATYVMDARNGDFLYGKNFDRRLNPASLTKMMTLYLTFTELKNKTFSLDSIVTVSKNSSREPPSKLGLLQGQKVSVRTLLRSAAIRSANDSATALGEFISGSETNFAEYMTRAARSMGMEQTVFKNANGLTAKGHLSSAKDMAILSRRLIIDFPEYYNLFGRLSVDVIGKKIYNTNRRFLKAYDGADGIKTGFTSAAGYNLAASAKRGKNRVIGIVIGGGSVALRTKRMSELLDIGFSKVHGNSSLIPLNPLGLSSRIKSYKNRGLIEFSFVPLKRPKLFMNDPVLLLIQETLGKGNVSDKDENNGSLGNMSVATGYERKGFYGSSDQGFWRVPIGRPFELTDKKSQITLSHDKASLDNKTPVSGELRAKKVKEAIIQESLELESETINVGFYFTRYNAEKALASIIINDVKLIKPKFKEIVEDTYRDKIGYKIKFYPFTFSSAKKSCTRLRAVGFLCEVSSN